MLLLNTTILSPLILFYTYTLPVAGLRPFSLFGCAPNDLVQFSQKSFLWGSSFLNTSAIGVVKASNSLLCRDKFKKIKRYSGLQNPSQNHVTVYLYVSNEGGNMILKSGLTSQTKMMKIKC